MGKCSFSIKQAGSVGCRGTEDEDVSPLIRLTKERDLGPKETGKKVYTLFPVQELCLIRSSI